MRMRQILIPAIVAGFMVAAAADAEPHDMVVTAESVKAGQIVNLFPAGGVAEIRLATAADPSRRADGFVLESVPAGGKVRLHLIGEIDGALSGLKPGETYFLGIEPGTVTTIPTGRLIERIGTALSARRLAFAPSEGGVQ
jgi:hypothetical protein